MDNVSGESRWVPLGNSLRVLDLKFYVIVFDSLWLMSVDSCVVSKERLLTY